MQRIFLSLNNFVGFSPNILGGIHVSWYLLWIFHNLSYVIPAGDIEEFYVFTAVELDRIREKIIPPTPRIVLVLSVMIRLIVFLYWNIIISWTRSCHHWNIDWFCCKCRMAECCMRLMGGNHFRNRAEKRYSVHINNEWEGNEHTKWLSVITINTPRVFP